MRKQSLVLCVATLVLVLTPSLSAQTTARLRGQVTDADGGALPGVTVTVSSDALFTGSRVSTTGTTGTYSFSALPPGLYSVRAELDEFQGQVREGIRAKINVTTTTSFQLLSTFTEALVVTSDAPLVNLTSSSVGSNYDAEFIEDLPLNRYFWDMMLLSPGVSGMFHNGSAAIIAFGSGVTNNNWKIDGVQGGSPYVGVSWQYLNPDFVEEVQVLGVGAPAEFGDMLGAAFNVVTKSGGNELEGSLSFFWQDDSLTDAPDQSGYASLNPAFAEFPQYTRDEFTDATLTLGGPLKQDKAWFFLAGQYYRNSFTQPAINPAFAGLDKADRYDFKVNFQPNEKSTFGFKFHYEDWQEASQGSVRVAPESRVNFVGEVPGWTLDYGKILTDRSYLEVTYGGWTGDMQNPSQTGSVEPALVTEPGFRISRGVYFPFDFDNSSDDLNVVVSHFAEDFLGGDHDFKFGVSASNSEVVSTGSPGVHGYYDYDYFVYDSEGEVASVSYYRYMQPFYTYGGEVETLSAFVDDSWQVSDKLTLNLGLRFDAHEGSIPDFERFDFNGQPIGEIIPGVNSVIDWKLFAPRLGFAYNPDGKTVVRGSFGIYYDKVLASNWNFPPPGIPPLQAFFRDPVTNELLGEPVREFLALVEEIDPDLKAPRALQYAFGFERQLKANMALGAQLIYKKTENLTGWEILDDGVYEEVSWTNPATGVVETLLSEISPASIRKGNQAGFTILGPDTPYEQKYKGLLLTFNKRYSGGWALMSSYTLSKSTGLIPRMFSNFQNNGLFGNRLGTDPNSWLDGDQTLQGDRKHMLRVQASLDLPWGLEGTVVANLQSGRPYSRQQNAARGVLSQGAVRITLVPASDDQRYGFQEIVDLAVGKRFELGDQTVLKLDLQLFNVLNEDAVERWSTLVVGENDFVPRQLVPPRRLMLRASLTF
jgi:outer membrane receptor protein involved in Fe transport